MASTPSRNGPCPCGSGRKHKRCCGRQTSDHLAMLRRQDRVGRESTEWAFTRFGDELTEAGLLIMPQVAHTSHAAWIGEHWVMLDYELRDGGTAAARYAALPRLDDADRQAAVRIATSRVGIHRVVASRPGHGMDLIDILNGTATTVISDRVSREAGAGDVVVARTMDGRTPGLWGPARTFTPLEVGLLFDALADLTDQPDDAALRRHGPALLACDTSAPRVLTTAEWRIRDADAVHDRLPETFEYARAEQGAQVYQWRIGPAPHDHGGLLMLYDDGLVAHSCAESTLSRMIAVLDDALGPLARFTGRSRMPFDAAQDVAFGGLAA